ncbi:MAG: hypothetical protein JWP11_3418 [Frankiales bacterium]|nr:hypothetical protein [Frankiales bacterium]
MSAEVVGPQEPSNERQWLPAYAQRRPDFERGNVLALKHAGYSDRAVTPVAQRVANLLVSIAPALVAYPLQVDLFSRTYAKVLILESALDEVGVLDEHGKPRETLLKHAASWTNKAQQQLREMGLTRKAAAELQLDVAVAAHAAVGAARQAEQASSAVRAFLQGRGLLPDADADHSGGDV